MNKPRESFDLSASRPVESSRAAKMDALVQLGGGVAHELNNALTSVLGNMQILAEKMSPLKDTPPQVMNALTSARRGVARVAALADRLQMATGGQHFESKAFSPGDYLNQLAGEIDDWTNHAIRTQIHVADDIWFIETDARQLGIAMRNLVTNAAEAMPLGGLLEISGENIVVDSAQAEKYALEQGEYVRITLIDNGEGMTMDVQQRAFELFFTTRSGRGKLGLGLAQVHNCLKRSHGLVRLAGAPDKGTQVELYFPRSHARTLAAEKGPAEGTAFDGTILVVEDDEDVSEYLLETLQDLDYPAVAVPDSEKALHYLELGESRFALLLTDVNLPGMNGLELARRAQARYGDLCVLIMSGNLQALQRDGEKKESLIGFIPKPMTKSQLAEQIGALFARRAERRPTSSVAENAADQRQEGPFSVSR